MRGLTSREPLLSTTELVPILGRARTTIQKYARRYRIGRRGSNRQLLFTHADIARLQALLSETSREPVAGDLVDYRDRERA